MSLNRGKRRRKVRRRGEFDSDVVEQSPDATTREKKPPSRQRIRKPLAERSAVIPTFLAGICVLGAGFMFFAARPIEKVPERLHGHIVHLHGHVVYTNMVANPSSFDIFLAIFYLVLGGIEGFIAFRIYRARGGWTKPQT